MAGAYTASRAAGLRLFDTAEVYGRGTSETLLGGLLGEHGDRADALVATKFAPLPWRAARRGPLTRALESSLARLQLERVELYQIHAPLPLVPDDAWMADLAAAVDRGLVGAVGVSNYGPVRLRKAHRLLADLGVALATNQVEYNLLSRRPERSGLVEVCAELGVTVIAYSPLAQGLLTGKYSRQQPPSGVRGLRHRRTLRRLPVLLDLLRELGAEHQGRTPAQVALNWLVTKGTVPIPGAKTAAQAEHNAGALGWRLDPEQVARLDRAAAR